MNATVVSNSAQIVEKVTCLMAITRYNSNSSLTPEFKLAFSKNKIIWMNSLTYQPRMKKDLGPSFVYDTRSNISTGTIWNPRQNLQLIHDPQCYQNPRICLIYGKNPQSARFLRSNPSIQKPIHPPHSIVRVLIDG